MDTAAYQENIKIAYEICKFILTTYYNKCSKNYVYLIEPRNNLLEYQVI